MFYEELYAELGKLFYHIAAADGNVQPSEKSALQQLIQSSWKPLEGSTDRFGTDQANVIGFSFDYEESQNAAGDGLQSFLDFYRQNKDRFTGSIVSNILNTARAVATAYHGKSHDESDIIKRLSSALKN